jgi:hypothetical protein
VVIFLTLLLRAPALWTPVLDPDEAGHAVGALVWLDGGVPYVDYVDNKQPLVYVAFAAVFALCGPSLVAVHWLTVPWLLLTAWLLGRVARAVHGPAAAPLAPTLFALASAAWVEKDMLATSTELLANLPLAAAFALALGGREPGREVPVRAALAGFLASTAALSSLKAALAWPALVLALAAPRAAAPEGAVRRARRVAAAALGGSLPLVAITLYFHARGALGALVEWNILANLRYAGTGPPLASWGVEGGILYGWPRLALFVAATLPLWVAAAVAGRRGARREPAANAVRLWLLLSLGGALLGGRLYGHYFIQVLPPLVVLASGPLGALPGEVAAGTRGRFLPGLAAAGLLLPVAGFAIAGHVRMGRRSLDALRPPLAAVTEAVRARTRPGDRIFVWGYWPQLYYPLAQAGRLPATRFVFPQTLAGYVPGRPGGAVPGRPARDFVVAAHWAQFLTDMERHPAELIVDTAPAAVHFWERYPIESSPALAALVESGYRREATVEGVVLYRRRAALLPIRRQP